MSTKGRCVEVFSGAGGLALGLETAGFQHEMLVEWNDHACSTIELNQRDRQYFNESILINGDIQNVSFQKFKGNVELVAGGPPCQPFSLGGKHLGRNDPRDMFPQAIRTVNEIQPKMFVFENVKGLLRESFSTYLEYILLRLAFPTIGQNKNEEWGDHLKRLERIQTEGRFSELKYNIVFRQLDAVNYGVPQSRKRVIIVGIRSDLGLEWNFPKETHSYEALVWDKWKTGYYWDEHKVARKARPALTERESKIIKRFSEENVSGMKRHLTVRDAIAGLPDPTKDNRFPNHIYRQGAKEYPGHTGSSIDEPSKTIKAGAHGVPGGENMLKTNDGNVRYFTVREAARIQTFPDDYIFSGSWGESLRQIGNAVPVKLASIIGNSLKDSLNV